MNIDNSIGMTLFSGELGSTAAIGSQQGSANGMAESPEGSLFQQLINQMLTGKNQTTEAAAGNLKSALLFTGGNLTNTGPLNAGETTSETAEIKGASGEQQTAEDNAGAMEMLQALMAGMTNTAAAANVEKAFVGIKTEKTAAQQLAAVNLVSDVSGNPAAAEPLKQMAANAAPQSVLNTAAATVVRKADYAETAEGTTAAQLGIRQIPEEQNQMMQTGGRWTSAPLSGEKAPAENGIISQEPGKVVLTNDSAEKPAAFSSQSILTPKAAVENQPAVSEIRTQAEFAASAEKAKPETETADGTDPIRTGLQNSVQGAVTTGDITEPGIPDQTVESMQPYSQIREEILTKLEQNGPTEFKMQLKPEDLGQIDIKLKLSEGKLVIDILAADSRTQALLTSQVDKLISSMGLQNVQVESVQVSQQMNSQTQDNSQSQGFTMNSNMDFSQRRQQEQSRQEILNNSNLAGTFSQQDQTKTSETMNRIESIRFDNHRMNYSV